MKKFKSLIAVLLIFSMLFAVGCSSVKMPVEDEVSTTENKDDYYEEEESSSTKKPDYEDLIKNFVPTELNTFDLNVGDEATVTFGSAVVNGKTVAYSSNESVVTVTDSGEVTAVGAGSAYVILSSADGGVSVIYRYDVRDGASKESAKEESEEITEVVIKEESKEDSDEEAEEKTNTLNLPEIPGVDFAYEIENFVSTGLNTKTLKVGDGHTPTAAVWAKNGGSCYTSDASVVEVAKNGNVFAKGAGTAYVVITGMGGMYDIYKYEVNG